MDTRRVKGLQVITHAGARVGTVDQVFFDPATKHVAAFALRADPERSDAAAAVVDVAAVHALGSDALTLSAAPAPPARRRASTSMRSCRRRS